MKKQEVNQQGDPQVMFRKNRNRLIDQNRQLYSEIFRLESKVSVVLTKNISSEFKQKVQEQKMSSKHRQFTQQQISEIKKLKKKILLIKNAGKPQQMDDMRQALDQLVFLKKEKQKYLFQKEALLKKRKLKEQGLQLNKPLQQQRKNMMVMYKATQRQNFDIKNKSLKIQKQIKHFHKIKQLSKTSVPKSLQNYDLQMKKTQNQMLKLQNELKQIQKQWQPRIDSLNTEYFLLKQIKDEKDKQINQLQRVLNNCKNRVLGMKQQTKIIQDKNRLSKIIISSEKRQQIHQIYEAQKQKTQFFNQFRNKSKDYQIKLLSKQEINKNKSKNSKSKSKSKSPRRQSLKILFQTQPVKLLESQIKINNNMNQNQFNEFSPIKQKIQSTQLKKPLKQYASIAIGTTFYYNEQQQQNDKQLTH